MPNTREDCKQKHINVAWGGLVGWGGGGHYRWVRVGVLRGDDESRESEGSVLDEGEEEY